MKLRMKKNRNINKKIKTLANLLSKEIIPKGSTEPQIIGSRRCTFLKPSLRLIWWIAELPIKTRFVREHLVSKYSTGSSGLQSFRCLTSLRLSWYRACEASPMSEIRVSSKTRWWTVTGHEFSYLEIFPNSSANFLRSQPYVWACPW